MTMSPQSSEQLAKQAEALQNGPQDTTTDGTTGFGPEFTEMICQATGPKASPRLRAVIADLIRHLHTFCRDNNITNEEYFAALDFVNEAGRMSNERRNEGQLLCGVLGLETLLDRMQNAGRSEFVDTSATASNLLGPFWQDDSPLLEPGADIIMDGSSKGRRVHMHGQVLDALTLKPVVGAELDVWHSNAEGIYAQQDPSQPRFNHRGRFLADGSGSYTFYCGRPAPYSIPDDGPAGKLIRLMDRHPMRPAHLHFIVKATGYETIITELFDSESKFVEDDCMYAVKKSLVVDFVPLKGNDVKPDYELKFNFYMLKITNRKL